MACPAVISDWDSGLNLYSWESLVDRVRNIIRISFHVLNSCFSTLSRLISHKFYLYLWWEQNFQYGILSTLDVVLRLGKSLRFSHTFKYSVLIYRNSVKVIDIGAPLLFIASCVSKIVTLSSLFILIHYQLLDQYFSRQNKVKLGQSCLWVPWGSRIIR